MSERLLSEFAVGLARQLCIMELLKVSLEDFKQLDTVRADQNSNRKKKPGETTMKGDAADLTRAISTYLIRTKDKVSDTTWGFVHRDMKREQVRDIGLLLDILIKMEDPGIIYNALKKTVDKVNDEGQEFTEELTKDTADAGCDATDAV